MGARESGPRQPGEDEWRPEPSGTDPGGPIAMTLLSFYYEKKPERGEDCEPIAARFGETLWAVGVCDGLGGAGATPVQTNLGSRTSAFVASRVAGKAVSRALSDTVEHSVPRPMSSQAARRERGEELRERLAEQLHDDLGAFFRKAGLDTGRIKGSTIRPLPTTLAVGLVHDMGDGSVEVDVLWAGDSRVYVLRPDKGLQQLTVDDLKSGGDAMSNLSEDSPMSNVVSADGNFTVNRNHLRLRAPAVVLAATDGCFGFLPTPAHFEALLLATMQSALPSGDGPDGWRTWENLLLAQVKEATGDDATMSVLCAGWPDFTSMARQFGPRHQEVSAWTAAVDRLAQKQEKAKAAVATAKAEYERGASNLWADYRIGYERPQRRIPPEPVAQATPPQPAADPPADVHGRPLDLYPVPEPVASGSPAGHPDRAGEAAPDAAGVPGPPRKNTAHRGPTGRPVNPFGGEGEEDGLTALSDAVASDPKQPWHQRFRDKL